MIPESSCDEDILLYPRQDIDFKVNTKRGILRASASVFDPLGYLLPIMIRTRLFIQQLWQAKLGWDTEISDEDSKVWNDLVNDIKEAIGLTFPRQIIYSDEVSLHVFSDASTKAYGSSVYVLSNNRSHLLISKAKIVGIKKITIPQLELTAAAFSARLIRYVIIALRDEISIRCVYAWTDSQIVLRWLKTNKPLKPYVQNRVDEIHILAPEVNWRYVPSCDNPCDILSRGTSFQNLQNSSWYHGPSWLTNNEKWPVWENEDENDTITPSISPLSVNAAIEEAPIGIMDLHKFGDYKRVIKITALVFRFINKLRDKSNANFSDLGQVCNHHISVDEFREAENYWFKAVQDDEFHDEISDLKHSNNKTTSRIQQLNLLLDSGMIRCRRRLDLSNLNYDTKFPILLPSKHRFTELLINYMHRLHGHTNASMLIILIRQKFWIPSIRRTVKAILKSCVACKRLVGTPYRAPPPPPLPKDRVTEVRPFSIVGIDYTGELNVKHQCSINKVYVALFTCAVTRAVHLELVSDNSRDAFLLAFRRFMSRRSTPTVIYSDNATTFKSAASYLKQLQSHPDIQNFLRERSIKWKFHPAKGPWFGGFIERLIGITKEALKKTLGNALVTHEELVTILTEVEMRVNNRPLTHVSDDLHDSCPLTPSDLLYGFQLHSIPYADEFLETEEEYGTRTLLTKRQKFLTKLLEHFWSRWSREYLTSLRNVMPNRSMYSSVTLGDIVLIHDERPRLQWKLGRIIHLYKGQDGRIRSAVLKTENGEISRPISKLYPLEVNTPQITENQSTENVSTERHSTRKAAIEACQRIVKQLEDSCN